MRRQGHRNRHQRQHTPTETKRTRNRSRKIPAKTAYLNLSGKYPVQRDWMVGTTGIEPVIPTVSRRLGPEDAEPEVGLKTLLAI